MMKGRFLTQEIISDFKEHKDFADFFDHFPYIVPLL